MDFRTREQKARKQYNHTKIKIPNTFRFVLCSMKRENNAKELVKKGMFYINGIGNTEDVLVNIDKECRSCKYQRQIDDERIIGKKHTWDCSYRFIRRTPKNGWYDRIEHLVRHNEEGKSIIDHIDKNYPNLRVLRDWHRKIIWLDEEDTLK